MSAAHPTASRLRAALATLARALAPAAAGTALYRNQQIPALPSRGESSPRARRRRRHALRNGFPVAPLCPLLPMR